MCSDQHAKYWMPSEFPLTNSLLLNYHVKQYRRTRTRTRTLYPNNLFQVINCSKICYQVYLIKFSATKWIFLHWLKKPKASHWSTVFHRATVFIFTKLMQAAHNTFPVSYWCGGVLNHWPSLGGQWSSQPHQWCHAFLSDLQIIIATVPVGKLCNIWYTASGLKLSFRSIKDGPTWNCKRSWLT